MLRLHQKIRLRPFKKRGKPFDGVQVYPARLLRCLKGGKGYPYFLRRLPLSQLLALPQALYQI